MSQAETFREQSIALEPPYDTADFRAVVDAANILNNLTGHLAFSSTDISVVAASGEFKSEGFIDFTEFLHPGDVFTTSGFTNAGNNATWTVLSVLPRDSSFQIKSVLVVTNNSGMVDEAFGQQVDFLGQQNPTYQAAWGPLINLASFVATAGQAGFTAALESLLNTIGVTHLFADGSCGRFDEGTVTGHEEFFEFTPTSIPR